MWVEYAVTSLIRDTHIFGSSLLQYTPCDVRLSVPARFDCISYLHRLRFRLNVRDSIRNAGRSEGFVEPNSLILASLSRDGRRDERGRHTFEDVVGYVHSRRLDLGS